MMQFFRPTSDTASNDAGLLQIAVFYEIHPMKHIISIELCARRDAAVHHQEVQPFTAVLLVYR